MRYLGRNATATFNVICKAGELDLFIPSSFEFAKGTRLPWRHVLKPGVMQTTMLGRLKIECSKKNIF
jgi:hypothetical protein